MHILMILKVFSKIFLFYLTEESTDIQPTESINCIDTWGSDCSQFVEKCSDPDYEWYQKACRLTCGKC